MALVKERLDGLNHAEFKLPRYAATTFDRAVVEIRARHNTVAFLKGDNSQPSSLNRPQPVAYRSWLQDDVAPAVVMWLRNPALLSTLDRIGLRQVASAARRRLLPSQDHQ
jgi:hypothetical protein